MSSERRPPSSPPPPPPDLPDPGREYGLGGFLRRFAFPQPAWATATTDDALRSLHDRLSAVTRDRDALRDQVATLTRELALEGERMLFRGEQAGAVIAQAIVYGEGLTRRDYFAAAALAAVIREHHASPKLIAANVYAIADALLEEREQ